MSQKNLIITFENGKEILKCSIHKQNITTVSLEQQKSLEEIFFCDDCISQVQGLYSNATSFDCFMDLLRDQFESTNEGFRENKTVFLKNITQFQQKLEQFQSDLNDNLNQIQIQFGKLISAVSQIGSQKMNPQILQAIQEFKDKNFDNDINKQLQNCKAEHFRYLHPQFKNTFQVLNTFPQYFKDILKIFDREYVLQRTNQKPQILEQVKEIPSNDSPTAMLFGGSSNFVIKGFQENITVWIFADQTLNISMKQPVTKGGIICLVASKKENWFASGHHNGAVLTWKYTTEQKWEMNEPTSNLHQKQINYILLNNSEDKLFSCSNDSIIKIWQVNCFQNRIQYFKNIVTNFMVIQIALNETQRFIISCHIETRLRVWKNDGLEWENFANPKIENSCYQVSFISEYVFIIQCQGTKQLILYSILGNQIMKKQTINLKQECRELNQVPIIVNKQKQILVHKSGCFLHIFLISKNGNLEIYKDLQFENNNFCFTLAENGNYLIVQCAKKLKIFEIKSEKQ